MVEAEREAAARKARKYTERGIGGAFRVVSDPCGTWTNHSSLTARDIQDLLRIGYLEPGTVFESDRERLSIHLDGEKLACKWEKKICST